MQSYGDQFFYGTINLLDNVASTVGPINIADVNLPSNLIENLKSEASAYITDNIGLASIKVLRTPEQAVAYTIHMIQYLQK